MKQVERSTRHPDRQPNERFALCVVRCAAAVQPLSEYDWTARGHRGIDVIDPIVGRVDEVDGTLRRFAALQRYSRYWG
jgi:hypothetical protein